MSDPNFFLPTTQYGWTESQQKWILPVRMKVQTWAGNGPSDVDSTRNNQAQESESNPFPNQHMQLQQWCASANENYHLLVSYNNKKKNERSYDDDCERQTKQKRNIGQQVQYNIFHEHKDDDDEGIKQSHSSHTGHEGRMQKAGLLLAAHAADQSCGCRTDRDTNSLALTATVDYPFHTQSFYEANYASRWCTNYQRNVASTPTQLAKFPPLFPDAWENEPTNNSWKKIVITFGHALALPGMEQEVLMAGNIRVVMALQEAECCWAELIYTKESGRSDLCRAGQVACWTDANALDRFRLGEKSAEWRNNYLDMAIPGSFSGAQYRPLRNPFFQQLKGALNLLQHRTRDKDKDNGCKDEAAEHDLKNERQGNQNAMCKVNEAKGMADRSIANPPFPQKPGYAVFIDVCPKRYSRKEGTRTGQADKFASDRFMNLLFASEACTVQEEGCERYMILIKRVGRQQYKATTAGNKKRGAGKKPQYTIYAVFSNEDAFQYHSSQGYSVLSDRFKELCAPLFPAKTSYTRHTI